jgi:acyl-coenzyme A thioesterase PaaI-like protein
MKTTTLAATVRAEPSPPSESLRSALRRATHASCFACGEPASAAPGLGLAFTVSPDGASVQAEWRAPAWAVGYDGLVHGGLLATALDAAMVHALFARGVVARTAALRIRYRQPVLTTAPCLVHARLQEKRGPLRRLSATLHQAGRLCVRADADFLSAPPALSPAKTPETPPAPPPPAAPPSSSFPDSANLSGPPRA